LRESANALMCRTKSFESPKVERVFGKAYSQHLIEIHQEVMQAFLFFVKREGELRAKLGKEAVQLEDDKDDDEFFAFFTAFGCAEPGPFKEFFRFPMMRVYQGGLVTAKDGQLIGMSRTLLSMDIKKQLPELQAWRNREAPKILEILEMASQN